MYPCQKPITLQRSKRCPEICFQFQTKHTYIVHSFSLLILQKVEGDHFSCHFTFDTHYDLIAHSDIQAKVYHVLLVQCISVKEQKMFQIDKNS